MASGYQDFIPAGEDAGALGAGFSDFVPPKTPVKAAEEKPAAPVAPAIEQAPVKETSK